MYHIAVLSYHTSPLAPLGGRDTGGMNVYVRELTRELAERGHAVDVFTRRSSADAPDIQAMPGGGRLVRIDAGPPHALAKARLAEHVGAFAEGVAAFAEAAGISYQVIHSHYWLSGLAGEQLKARWRAPHVTMFHTLGGAKNSARLSEHEPDARLEGERAVAAVADRIVCTSHEEQQALARDDGVAPERIAIVPCGVNLDLFRPISRSAARKQLGIGDGERILLFVGRVEPLKGIDILLGAAARLEVEGDSDCFVMVVGGDASAPSGELAHLRGLASELGIAERVSFLGAIDHEQLPLYYNAADVCVVPSFYESFGLVALEAMACGIPVVASRVGGLRGTVRDGETGYLIPWRCPEPFAERLELLMANEELRRAFGVAAREAVERYRWSNVADAVLDAYAELIEGRPAAANG
jgi:D-inositol-3-phosphate glycosyltransferase